MAIKRCKQGKTRAPKMYIVSLGDGTAIYGDRHGIARQWQGLTVHPDNHLPIGDELCLTDRNAKFEAWQHSSDYRATVNTCIAEGDIVGSDRYKRILQNAFSDWLIINF